MNMSAGGTFELTIPPHAGTIRDLVLAKDADPGVVLKIPPRTTVVLHFK